MSDGDMVEALEKAIDAEPDVYWAMERGQRIPNAALERILSAIESREGWQDIATAPRDGTRIMLAYGPAGLWTGHWRDQETARGHDRRLPSAFTRDGFSDTGTPGPTHWMPLPSPPIRNGEG